MQKDKKDLAWRLILRLVTYFGALIAFVLAVGLLNPRAAAFLPLDGVSLDLPGVVREIRESSARQESGLDIIGHRLQSAFKLAVSLAGTVVLILPISWVYIATRYDTGFRKSFIDALMILPICVTGIVLLIQDSLSLAFGLAALVAAVRFRVDLQEASDAVYVFAAICIGLASGVGYLGIAIIMSAFFCFACIALWGSDYGANPLDQARMAKKIAKKQRPDEQV